MNFFHSTISVISRSGKRTPAGVSAYISGTALYDQKRNIMQDYTRKHGVIYNGVMLCENAPREYENRAVLWNAVENTEKHSSAQLARNIEFALPCEMTSAEQIIFAQDYIRDNFVKAGMCADWALHRPDRGNDNPHVHLMLTMRPIEPDGSWGLKSRKEYILDKNGDIQYDKENKKYECRTIKTTNWDEPERVIEWRADLAARINLENEKRGIIDRVSPLSYEEQGIDKIPTTHIGKSAKAMEERRVRNVRRGKENPGVVPDRVKINNDVIKANVEIMAIKKEMSHTEYLIFGIQQGIGWNRIHDANKQLEAAAFDLRGATNEQVQKKLLEAIGKQAEAVRIVSLQDYHKGDYIEITGKNIPWLEANRSKYDIDVTIIKKAIEKNLAEIERNRQEPAAPKAAPEQTATTGAKAEQVAQIGAPEPAATTPRFDLDICNNELVMSRIEFIQTTTAIAKINNKYQSNPVPEREATQIEDSAKTIKEQTAVIEKDKAKLSGLGLFDGREKNRLKAEISEFEGLRDKQYATLNGLGVTALAQAPEIAAIKREQGKAENERIVVTRDKELKPEFSKAKDAAARFEAAARSVPPDARLAVAAAVMDERSHDNSATTPEHWEAIKAATNTLDSQFAAELAELSRMNAAERDKATSPARQAYHDRAADQRRQADEQIKSQRKSRTNDLEH